MIQDLLTAHANTNQNPKPFLIKVIRKPTMTASEAAQLCAELLNDHKIRFSPSYLRYLGGDLIWWLNEKAGSWVVVKATSIPDGNMAMIIAVENEDALSVMQLVM